MTLCSCLLWVAASTAGVGAGDLREPIFRALERGEKPGSGQGLPQDLLWLLAYLSGDDISCAGEELAPGAQAYQRLLRTRSFVRQGREEEARKSLAALIKARPGFGLAEADLAGLHAENGDRKTAAELWSLARRHDLSLVWATAAEGQAWLDLGEWDRAYQTLRRAERDRPGDLLVREGLKRVVQAEPKVLERDLTRKETARAAALGKPLVEIPWAGGPLVKIGLVEKAGQITLRSNSSLLLRDLSGKPLAEWPAGRDFEIPRSFREIPGKDSSSFAHEAFLILPSPGAAIAILDVARDKGTYWGMEEDLEVRGAVLARSKAGLWSLSNEVPIDTYVLGVLPGEMPAAYPQEALQAQAVAARSEALSKLGRHRKQGYDVCAGAHCAVYRGRLEENDAYRKATRDTSGIILEIAAVPAPALFTANCGGLRHSEEEAWGGDRDGEGGTRRMSEDATILDLKPGVRGPGEGLAGLYDFLTEDRGAWCGGEGTHGHRWVTVLEASEILAKLKAREGAVLTDVVVLSRDDSGYVRSIRVDTSRGETVQSRVFRTDGVRTALPGIRSNLFILMTRKRVPPPPHLSASRGQGHVEEVILVGGGWGHGVGLCQQGARGRALAGQDFSTILRAYLPDRFQAKKW